VNTRLREWKATGHPRRAGVSSFGIGGTNAHVVIEQGPEVRGEASVRPAHLLVISARTGKGLEEMSGNLREYLRGRPGVEIADVAYTLQVGRRVLSHRRMVVCRDAAEAVEALEQMDWGRVRTREQERRGRKVGFLFSGQGSQYVNMGRGLYERGGVFRQEMDRCAEAVRAESGIDIREVIYPERGREAEAGERLMETEVTQPALYAVEYALARQWMEWGVKPEGMLGHSLGEYVAATVAGVMSWEEGARLMAIRGRLMGEASEGAMVAVWEGEEEVRRVMVEGVSLSAVNGERMCVVGGGEEEIRRMEERLAEEGVRSRRLEVRRAFHSEKMRGAAAEYVKEMRKVRLRRPKLRYISNVSGRWIREEEATEARYWERQMVECVRYWEGMKEMRRGGDMALLEVGPGESLSRMGGADEDGEREEVVSSLGRGRGGGEREIEWGIGRLWQSGVVIDWERYNGGERRVRVEAPGYAFDRERYWVERREEGSREREEEEGGLRKRVEEWFYVPVWKEGVRVRVAGGEAREREEAGRWMVLSEGGVGEGIAERLKEIGEDVVVVRRGRSYRRMSEREYEIREEEERDYEEVMKEMKREGREPGKVVHVWSIGGGKEGAEEGEGGGGEVEGAEIEGRFYSLMRVARAIAEAKISGEVEIEVVTRGVQVVTGSEEIRAEGGMVAGPVKVIGQEYANVKCRSIDMEWSRRGGREIEKVVDEMRREMKEKEVAIRGEKRWVRGYERVKLEERKKQEERARGEKREGERVDERVSERGSEKERGRLRERGVYVVTGGMGAIGLEIGMYIAREVKGKIVLVGRNGLGSEGRREEEAGEGEGEGRKKGETETREEDTREKNIREREKKIRERIREMEEQGAEVEVMRGDVSKEEEIRGVIERVYEKYGEINGLFHCAGAPAAASVRPIQDTSYSDFEAHFQPKVYGLRVLDRVLEGRQIDFCLVQSSLSSILGGLGFFAYSAANSFADAFVREHNQRSSVPWISVNWDGWNFAKHTEADAASQSRMTQLAITPAEGIDALDRILHSYGADQIIVSTRDLYTRIEEWVDLSSIRNREPLSYRDASSFHPRPALQNAYIAPANQLEQTVASIWQELLGIEQIGIDDDFFEVGGHSLLGIQMLSRIREAFNVDLPLRNVFERPTVADLASMIEEALIAEIEECSEEEAQRLLEMG
jgi:acyl transferase domain-containing protein/acyl carrier protein